MSDTKINTNHNSFAAMYLHEGASWIATKFRRRNPPSPRARRGVLAWRRRGRCRNRWRRRRWRERRADSTCRRPWALTAAPPWPARRRRGRAPSSGGPRGGSRLRCRRRRRETSAGRGRCRTRWPWPWRRRRVFWGASCVRCDDEKRGEETVVKIIIIY